MKSRTAQLLYYVIMVAVISLEWKISCTDDYSLSVDVIWQWRDGDTRCPKEFKRLGPHLGYSSKQYKAPPLGTSEGPLQDFKMIVGP